MRPVQPPVRPRPDLCPAPFLWKLLDEHGKRCVVMDAFLTCPLQNFTGVQIVDWGSWTHFGTRRFCRKLAREIARGSGLSCGGSQQGRHDAAGRSAGFRDRFLRRSRRRPKSLRWLADTQRWDFLLAVFGECHAAGHYFWHYQDSSYVAHPQEVDTRLRTALRDVYIALDHAVGRMLELADDRTTVLVVSGDGMGPNYSGSHLLTRFWRRMRLLNDPASGEDPRPDARRICSVLCAGSFRAIIARRGVATLLPRAVNEQLSLRWRTAAINWASTRAFVIENANEGFIRFNLHGREPEGVVQPGEVCGGLRAHLADTAATLINPATGRLAVHRVFKADDILPRAVPRACPTSSSPGIRRRVSPRASVPVHTA